MSDGRRTVWPMAEITRLLRTLTTPHNGLSVSDDESWVDLVCPHCGTPRLVMVAADVDGNFKPQPGMTRWLRCAACKKGCIETAGVLHPAVMPLREPIGLPSDDGRIWREARTCLGVGANAAAVMLCRKLLFHIAVSHGLPPKNKQNRAPGFAEAVKHLAAEGIVTRRMLPWVDRIKDVGNDASHELSPITAEQALDVATFTEQLLRLAYEMDALMGDPAAADELEGPPRGGVPGAGGGAAVIGA